MTKFRFRIKVKIEAIEAIANPKHTTFEFIITICLTAE